MLHCITIDSDSLSDEMVTLRDRDTTKQQRVPMSEAVSIVEKEFMTFNFFESMRKNLKIIMKTKFTLFIFGFIFGDSFTLICTHLSNLQVNLLFLKRRIVLAQKKVILVLGSGGIRGLAHLGVLEVLEKHKIPISEIVGCSAGSLIGAFYAATLNSSYSDTYFVPKGKDLVDFDLLGLRYGLSSKLFIIFDKNLPVMILINLKFF